MLAMAALCLALFGLILLLGSFLPQPATWALSLAWAAWTVWSCHAQLKRLEDLPARLARTCRRHGGLFHGEAEALLRAWGSAEAKAAFFAGQPEGIAHGYDLIRRRIWSDMESALHYAESYDYVSRPDPRIMRELVLDGNDMVVRLNRLSDYVFRIDEGAGDVDVSGLDDLLHALETVDD